jgi:hypothetical protein
VSAYRRGRAGGGSRWMTLRYPGRCKVCGAALRAGTLAFWDAGARTVTCERIDCADADGLTTNKPLPVGQPDRHPGVGGWSCRFGCAQCGCDAV